MSNYDIHNSIVQTEGISSDGVWYYHPAILLHLGEECRIQKVEHGKRAIIYNIDGSTWQGLARVMAKVNISNKRS